MKKSLTIKIISVFIIATLSISCETNPKQVNDADKEVFTEVEYGRISVDGGLSRGVAWGDYDGDGDPDLYVSNSDGQWNALYRNQGNGDFKKITSHTIKASETVIYGGRSQGINWIDYDNDGDLDLYVVNRGPEANFLFQNIENREFKKIEDNALSKEGISASMACWSDIENDGDLDVFLAGYNQPNMVFKNNGEGQFENIVNTPLTNETEGRARACGSADIDHDGLPEFYIANARRPNAFYKNLGDWNFEQVTEGHLVEDIGYSYGVSFADYNDDDDLDLFVVNFDKENFLYDNDGKGNFTHVTEGSLASEKAGASKGHSWGDYDNDGDLDVFIANGTHRPEMNNFLFLNQGDGTFVKNLSSIFQAHTDTSAGLAHADFDRDGDLDVFVANWGSRDQKNRFYKNITEGNNWTTLRLKGVSSNTYGVGAKAHIFISKNNSSKQLNRWMYPITGYASQNDYELHFGLGKASLIDSLVIKWPSGQKDVYKNIAINKHWVAVESDTLIATN